jgi:hypothetical protein
MRFSQAVADFQILHCLHCIALIQVEVHNTVQQDPRDIRGTNSIEHVQQQVLQQQVRDF